MPEPQCNAGYTALKSAILTNEPPQAAPGVSTENALLNGAIAVYRNNVRAAYYRVLRDAFPVVHKLVGDSYFRRLAHDYFLAHPPASRLVARYGDNLPAFIAAYPSCASFPYLSDVARLRSYGYKPIMRRNAHPFRGRDNAPAGRRSRSGDDPAASVGANFCIAVSNLGYLAEQTEKTIRRRCRYADAKNMSCLSRPEQDVRVHEISRGAYLTLRSLEATARLGEAFGKEFDAAEDLASIFQQIFAASVITDISHV